MAPDPHRRRRLAIGYALSLLLHALAVVAFVLVALDIGDVALEPAAPIDVSVIRTEAPFPVTAPSRPAIAPFAQRPRSPIPQRRQPAPHQRTVSVTARPRRVVPVPHDRAELARIVPVAAPRFSPQPGPVVAHPNSRVAGAVAAVSTPTEIPVVQTPVPLAPPPNPSPAAAPAPVGLPSLAAPTAPPTAAATAAPTAAPSLAPTAAPTVAPTAAPTVAPTVAPTTAPTAAPTAAPTVVPTAAPAAVATAAPTVAPTAPPTRSPAAASPSVATPAARVSATIPPARSGATLSPAPPRRPAAAANAGSKPPAPTQPGSDEPHTTQSPPPAALPPASSRTPGSPAPAADRALESLNDRLKNLNADGTVDYRPKRVAMGDAQSLMDRAMAAYEATFAPSADIMRRTFGFIYERRTNLHPDSIAYVFDTYKIGPISMCKAWKIVEHPPQPILDVGRSPANGGIGGGVVTSQNSPVVRHDNGGRPESSVVQFPCTQRTYTAVPLGSVTTPLPLHPESIPTAGPKPSLAP